MKKLPKGGRIVKDERTIRFLFEQDTRVLSTSVYGGGIRDDIRSIINFDEKDPDGRCLMKEDTYEKHLGAIVKSLSEDPDRTTILSTAADMKNAVIREAVIPYPDGSFGSLLVLATGGIDKNGARAGDPSSYMEEEGHYAPLPGTINLFLCTDAALLAGTLARAMMTMTEAKTAALTELHLRSFYSQGLATGSGTDGCVLCCDPKGKHLLTAAGKDCLFGSLIGRLTKEAVRETIGLQTGYTKTFMHHAGRRLERFGLSLEEFDDSFCERNASYAAAAEALLDEFRYGTLTGKEAYLSLEKLTEDGDEIQKKILGFAGDYLL